MLVTVSELLSRGAHAIIIIRKWVLLVVTWRDVYCNRSTHQYLLPHTVSGWAFGSVCLLVCPHVLYMWGYPTLHCCYLTKKSMVLNKLVDFVSASGYKWSVCVPCKTLWGEPEWEQTAQTELAFTELCWSVSAPYYRCLDHVLAVACPLSVHQSQCLHSCCSALLPRRTTHDACLVTISALAQSLTA